MVAPSIVLLGCHRVMFYVSFMSFGFGLEPSSLVVGGIMLALGSFFGIRRHFVVHRAWKDLLPDKARYDEHWHHIKEVLYKVTI